MTNQEAINNLNMISVAFVEPVTKEQRKLIDDTFDMAIKALEQEPNVEELQKRSYLEGFHEALKMALKQEPSGDLISRDKVHEIIAVALSEYITDEERETLETLDVDVANIPTVQEPKTGHWIEVTNGRGGHECSLCHEYAPSYQSGDEYLTKYCPNCGAKMVEPQERSDKE